MTMTRTTTQTTSTTTTVDTITAPPALPVADAVAALADATAAAAAQLRDSLVKAQAACEKADAASDASPSATDAPRTALRRAAKVAYVTEWGDVDFFPEVTGEDFRWFQGEILDGFPLPQSQAHARRLRVARDNAIRALPADEHAAFESFMSCGWLEQVAYELDLTKWEVAQLIDRAADRVIKKMKRVRRDLGA
jgi:hypothetical protein